MAWTTPQTVVADSTELTAALWNEQVRDNSAYLKAEADAVGLVHITTQTFVSTLSFSVNNCFSADFESYRLVYVSSRAGAAITTFRLRANGVDASVSGTYLDSAIRFYGTSTIDSNLYNTLTYANLWNGTWQAGQQNATVDIFKPAVAAPTFYQAVGSSVYVSGSGVRGLVISQGEHTVSTAFDGFSISNSANISGTVSVYGYRNA